MQLSPLEIVRRESLKKLIDLGINPYPAEEFKTTATIKEITSNFNSFEGKEVVLAGRMMSRRIMGKASFAELKDASGRMQIYVNRDEISSEEDPTMYNTVFKKLLDMGDIIGVRGDVFKTNGKLPEKPGRFFYFIDYFLFKHSEKSLFVFPKY